MGLVIFQGPDNSILGKATFLQEALN